MKASELNKNIEKLNSLSSEQKGAILNPIDIKINSDMEKFMLKLDGYNREMNAKVDSIKWFIITAFSLLGIVAIFKFLI